jgi:hypothetical protein
MLAKALLASSVAAASAAAAPPMPAVDAWGPNSFRVRWAAPGFPLAESPYSPYVAQSEANVKTASSPARTFEKAPGVLASVNGNLEVDVDAATGLVSVLRVSDGHLLMQQTALLWTPASCYGAVCPSADLPPSAELQFNGYVTEVFVGGGEQGTRRRVTLEENFGRDYADTEYYGYNSGRQAFLPLFFSSVGYGFMNAQPGYGHMQWQSAVAGAPLATPGVQQSVFNASSIKVVDVWFTTTPDTPVFNESVPHPFLALLDQYADAVGHAPLMPAFASGFIASKDRYRNQTQFLDVARGYIARNIPISMLTVDWFHWPALGEFEGARSPRLAAARRPARLRSRARAARASSASRLAHPPTFAPRPAASSSLLRRRHGLQAGVLARPAGHDRRAARARHRDHGDALALHVADERAPRRVRGGGRAGAQRLERQGGRLLGLPAGGRAHHDHDRRDAPADGG